MNNPELDELKQEMRNSLDFGRCVRCGGDYPDSWPAEELEEGWRYVLNPDGHPRALECDCGLEVDAPLEDEETSVEGHSFTDELLKIFKTVFISRGKITPENHRPVLQSYLIGAAATAHLGHAPDLKREVDEMLAEIGDRNWQPYGKFL
jgi:hypothetical protein